MFCADNAAGLPPSAIDCYDENGTLLEEGSCFGPKVIPGASRLPTLLPYSKEHCHYRTAGKLPTIRMAPYGLVWLQTGVGSFVGLLGPQCPACPLIHHQNLPSMTKLVFLTI